MKCSFCFSESSQKLVHLDKFQVCMKCLLSAINGNYNEALTGEQQEGLKQFLLNLRDSQPEHPCTETILLTLKHIYNNEINI